MLNDLPKVTKSHDRSHDSNVQILMCLIMKFMNFLILNAEWSIFYIKFYFPYFFHPFKWSDLLNTSKSIVWKKENVFFSFYLLSLTMLFLILFLSCNTLMRKISLVLGYIQVLNQTNLAQLKISITWSCWLFPFPTPQTQGDNQLGSANLLHERKTSKWGMRYQFPSCWVHKSEVRN